MRLAGKTVFQSQGPLSVFTLRETRLQSAYMDSINTTLNVIFADGKKSSVNSNYYNLRNSVPLLSAYHKTKRRRGFPNLLMSVRSFQSPVADGFLFLIKM